MTLRVTLNVPFNQVESVIQQHVKKLNQQKKEVAFLNPLKEAYLRALRKIQNGLRSISSTFGSSAFSFYIDTASDLINIYKNLKEYSTVVKKKKINQNRIAAENAGRLRKRILQELGIYLYLKRFKEREIMSYSRATAIFRRIGLMYRNIKNSYARWKGIIGSFISPITMSIWALGASLLANFRSLLILGGLGLIAVGAYLLVNNWKPIVGYLSNIYGWSTHIFDFWTIGWTNAATSLSSSFQTAANNRVQQDDKLDSLKDQQGSSMVNNISNYTAAQEPSLTVLTSTTESFISLFAREQETSLNRTGTEMESSGENMATDMATKGQKLEESSDKQQELENTLTHMEGLAVGINEEAETKDISWSVLPPEEGPIDKFFGMVDKAFEPIDVGIDKVIEGIEEIGKAVENVPSKGLIYPQTGMGMIGSTTGGEVSRGGLTQIHKKEDVVNITPNQDVNIRKSIIVEGIDIVGRQMFIQQIARKISEYQTEELYRRQTTLL